MSAKRFIAISNEVDRLDDRINELEERMYSILENEPISDRVKGSDPSYYTERRFRVTGMSSASRRKILKLQTSIEELREERRQLMKQMAAEMFC